MATPLREAGRVLSAANEAKVRAAIESLESVLAALGVLPDDGDNESAAEATRESADGAGRFTYSSTQVNLPLHIADAMRDFAARIPDADLAADGREGTPHVTVKYGIHTADPTDVQQALADEPPAVLRFGETSIFPGGPDKDFDVVKVDVDSPDLIRLNAKIAAATPVTDTHPEYHPHATLAYVQKGLGAQYAGDPFLVGQTVTADTVQFSSKSGDQVPVRLTGEPLRESAADYAAWNAWASARGPVEGMTE